MKRFFCTTCNKVKRVRVLPMVSRTGGKIELVGICRFHGNSGVRKLLMSRVRFIKHIGSTRKMSAGQQKSKSKK